MVSGMVMPISMHCEIVDAGRTTDPVELLKKDEKHVPFQITDKQRPSSGRRRSRIMCRCNRAAVRRLWILSGRGKGDQAAGTKWTAGVHKTNNELFAVQTMLRKGKSAEKLVRGKMDPCAVTFIKTPEDLDKNFNVCAELARRFVKNAGVQQEGNQLPGSGFEWAKARVFYDGNTAGRYHFLAPVWAKGGDQFTCRSIIPKGPQSHKYTFGLFNTPP